MHLLCKVDPCRGGQGQRPDLWCPPCLGPHPKHQLHAPVAPALPQPSPSTCRISSCVCVFTGGQEGEAAPSVHIVATRGHPRPCPLAKAASRALVLGLFLLEIMLLKRTGSLSVVSPSCLTSPDLSNLAFKAVLIRKPGMWV